MVSYKSIVADWVFLEVDFDIEVYRQSVSVTLRINNEEEGVNRANWVEADVGL